VALINGAQAKNLYWLVNGAADIADNSQINGTIVSQGAINLFSVWSKIDEFYKMNYLR
jgi:hypothetical protein